MHKPHLTLWQIWNMSFGFLGIQFGWSLQEQRSTGFSMQSLVIGLGAVVASDLP